MEPRIEMLTEKKLVGKSLVMSFSNNTTGDLWRSFMPRRHTIGNCVGNELYCVQLYPATFFAPLDVTAEFQKWATMEVVDFDAIPADMEALTLASGLYAVFFYKGAASAAAPTFKYIFETWLPHSEYKLDHRAHFEILGDKYKNEDPASEEEIWIPIKLRI